MILIIDTSSSGIRLVLNSVVSSPPVEGCPNGAGWFSRTRDSQKYYKLSYNETLTKRAKELRKAGSLPEALFWKEIKNKKICGLDFDRQKIIGNYIVDFFCAELGLVIEIDDKASHEWKENYDEKRDQYLQSLELNVIHISAEAVLKNPSDAAKYLEYKIQTWLNHPAPLGHPSTGGELSLPIIKNIQTEKQSLSLPVETEAFLKENNAKFSDLTAIGVVVGPGSFTGIRLSIAYAKGLAMGLGIPVVPVNAFEIYLESDPDAFVAIDSGKGDFFVGANPSAHGTAEIKPAIMTIEEVETKQFEYPKTVGHKPYDLINALPIVQRKLNADAMPVIPLYIRASYAEQNCKPS